MLSDPTPHTIPTQQQCHHCQRWIIRCRLGKFVLQKTLWQTENSPLQNFIAFLKFWKVIDNFIWCGKLFQIVGPKYLRLFEPNLNWFFFAISISNYCISSNMRPLHLLNFETVRCSAYQRAALVTRRHLFQSYFN